MRAATSSRGSSRRFKVFRWAASPRPNREEVEPGLAQIVQDQDDRLVQYPPGAKIAWQTGARASQAALPSQTNQTKPRIVCSTPPPSLWPREVL